MVLAASSVCYAAGGPEDANEVTDPNSVAYWWQWTAAWCAGRDLNADGVINLRDFATLAQSWAER